MHKYQAMAGRIALLPNRGAPDEIAETPGLAIWVYNPRVFEVKKEIPVKMAYIAPGLLVVKKLFLP